MQDKNIFIHIPKTGGTTINSAMNGTYWQTEIGFNYRHIDPQTKLSTSKDIFQPENFQKYSDYVIFMMLRDPLDRVVSEYYFLRERKEFMSLLNKPAPEFKDYYNNPQTMNYMLGFLVGKRIYTSKPPTETDLEKVIRAIDEIPVHVGIFEYFSESMGHFQELTGVKWNKKIEAKRMTFNRPKVDELDEETKDAIRRNNSLDQQLYDYGLKKFMPLQQKFKNYSVDFELSKYNHIFPYMVKTCLFEFCLDNKLFIKENFQFFKSLTMHLLNEKKMRDGEDLVRSWNQTVVNHINHEFPNSDFSNELSNALHKDMDPLKNLILLAETINQFFLRDPKSTKAYYKSMSFNSNLVFAEKKGFIKRLFG